MDSNTSTILGLAILLAIGGFVCFAMYRSRRTPPQSGATGDTDYASGGAGAASDHTNSHSDGGGH